MKKEFKFNTKRGKKIDLSQEEPVYEMPKEGEEIELTPIQGIMPASKEEYFVAMALNRLGIDYIYQYEIAGGRELLGGQVVDFLVNTVPIPTPVFVQGDYWHGGTMSSQSKYRVMMAEHYFAGYAQPPLELWEHELTSSETAYLTVKTKLL